MAYVAILMLAMFSIQQLTQAMPFPQIKVPSHAVPGFEVTRLRHIGQTYRLHHLDQEDVSSLFNITEDGVLKTIQQLHDYADKMFNMVVEQFLDTDSWSDSFSIYISDGQQDNSVAFISKVFVGNVKENSHIGTQVAIDSSMTACYVCTGIEYRLNGDDSAKFRLEYSGPTVKIFTADTLDREVQSEYTLTLTATMSSESTSSELRISIEDVNDNPPVFEHDFYKLTIPEISPADAQVILVHASDADVGENGRVTYQMDNNDMTFSVHPDTGSVIIGGPLYPKEYTFTVFANDHGIPRLEGATVVYITVTPVDLSLKFTSILEPGPVISYEVLRESLPDIEATIKEDVPLGTVVADNIPSEPSSDRFLMNNPLNPRFHINYITGEVLVAGHLNHQEHPVEEVYVEITQDYGKPNRPTPKKKKVPTATLR